MHDFQLSAICLLCETLKYTVLILRIKGVVSKETVVVHLWGSSIQKFWFYQQS